MMSSMKIRLPGGSSLLQMAVKLEWRYQSYQVIRACLGGQRWDLLTKFWIIWIIYHQQSRPGALTLLTLRLTCLNSPVRTPPVNVCKASTTQQYRSIDSRFVIMIVCALISIFSDEQLRCKQEEAPRSPPHWEMVRWTAPRDVVIGQLIKYGNFLTNSQIVGTTRHGSGCCLHKRSLK